MRLDEIKFTKAKSSYKLISSAEVLKYKNLIAPALAQYKKGVRFYRGIDNMLDSYSAFHEYTDKLKPNVKANLLFDPTGMNRKANGIENWFNLMIDSSPYWSRWPKRSQSIVCTTSSVIAGGYGGNIFTVLPIGNPSVAIAPNSDFWTGFSLKTPYDLRGPTNFNEFIINLYEHTTNKLISNNTMSQINPDRFRQQLNDLQKLAKEKYKNMSGYDEDDRQDFKEETPLNKIVYSKNKLTSYIDKALAPKSNNFKLSDFNKMPKLANREVWFNGPAILMFDDVFDVVFGEELEIISIK